MHVLLDFLLQFYTRMSVPVLFFLYAISLDIHSFMRQVPRRRLNDSRQNGPSPSFLESSMLERVKGGAVVVFFPGFHEKKKLDMVHLIMDRIFLLIMPDTFLRPECMRPQGTKTCNFTRFMLTIYRRMQFFNLICLYEKSFPSKSTSRGCTFVILVELTSMRQSTNIRGA